ncbi:leucine-rich repeat-containing protein 47-like [Aethina tumida]|uniref:leucine-rich repeat-containing protein 47-like n=1 Tax=Aethina tumida TaxID=116153 RepID=UPI00214755C2|nr:leucine-rich repeat-containing protein 47-like [Aethina tumida]
MWPEVETVQKENRHELVLSGHVINERLEKNGLDSHIFELDSLNYLNISDTKLENVPDEIGKLVNLQSLVLHSNKLEVFNENICKLPKLKVLDLSKNQLKSVPESLGQMTQLVTLNLSQNLLETFPEMTKTVKLTDLHLHNNKLTSFPNICSNELTNFFELNIKANEIETVPADINKLQSLKVLDMSSNKIKSLPGELADCTKLKDLNLKQNPIADRRLFKLIEQCKPKQVLDYIKQHCPRSNNEITQSKKGKKGKNRTVSIESDDADYKYTITVQRSPENGIWVDVEPSVKTVREHILCCVIQDVKFTEELYKKFIQLQNKLHETVCERRNAATIATHDLNKLPSGQLLYTTKTPQELQIKPLNRAGFMTGAELFSRLQTEANNMRKEKKRNTYSGLHKYLYLIEGKPRYPCLLNSAAQVISFPPITNSDISKIEVQTSSIFVEVTSSLNMDTCRKVLDTLLRETVALFDSDLTVVQVRTMSTQDGDFKLKGVYPAKVDLNYATGVNIKVVRE